MSSGDLVAAETNTGPSPMEMLVEDMKSDLIEARINGMKNLVTIAKALGPEKTRHELLPFLVEQINDEDEVFFEIAQQISLLADCIGEASNFCDMVPLFDLLLSIEENCVRDKTIEEMKEILKKSDTQMVSNCYISLVRNLVDSPWFTKKICACKLIGFLHEFASYENQIFLVDKFINLTKEDMPLIRKTAATYLYDITQNLYSVDYQFNAEESADFEAHKALITTKNAFVVFSKMFPVLEKLANDDQDMVRVLLLPQISKVLELIVKDFTPEAQQQLLMPLITSILSDQSWKVRSMCSAEIINFLQILDSQIFSSCACDKFLEYLNDADNEVVVRSTLHISSFVDALPENCRKEYIITKLSPKIEQFVNSTNVHIKTSLSKSIVNLTKHLSKGEVAEHLLPYYMSLLRDQNSDINLTTISQVCRSDSESLSILELSSTIFDSISELIRDPNWRVREQVVKLLPNLINTIGFESDESNELIKTCLQMLSDSVYAVRQAVIETNKKLVEIKGYQWAQTKLIPTISELNTSQNYLTRQVCISCIASFSEFLNTEEVIELYELVKSMSDDPVPSVKLRLLMFYEKNIYPKLQTDSSEQSAEIRNEIRSQVEKLVTDIDPDVSDRANDFIELVNAA